MLSKTRMILQVFPFVWGIVEGLQNATVNIETWASTKGRLRQSAEGLVYMEGAAIRALRDINGTENQSQSSVQDWEGAVTRLLRIQCKQHGGQTANLLCIRQYVLNSAYCAANREIIKSAVSRHRNKSPIYRSVARCF